MNINYFLKIKIGETLIYELKTDSDGGKHYQKKFSTNVIKLHDLIIIIIK